MSAYLATEPQPAPTEAPAVAGGAPRILCVDDEPYVLEGLRDMLRRHFELVTTTDGAEAVALLAQEPSAYAAVISDMRMPGMSGSVVLREARRVAPDVVRMLLTGQADLTSAIEAVNDGQVFRFLLKPCGREQLVRACTAAVTQHRLQMAERVLLEQTVRGSIEALTRVLALVSPAAFGRGARLKEAAGELAAAAGLEAPWEIEVAASLVDLGAVTLPSDLAERAYEGEPLTPDEAAMVADVPATTVQILSHIPRLEGVVEPLRYLIAPTDDIPVGARILRTLIEHDELLQQGLDPATAVATLRSRQGTPGKGLLDTFTQTLGVKPLPPLREIPLSELQLGMELATDVRSTSGRMLIARGFQVNPELLVRLRNLPNGLVREPLHVFMEATA